MLLFITFIVWIIQTQNIQISLKFTKSKIPYLSMEDLCRNSPVIDVILDTGSSQFWLADNKCSSCPKTQQLCPHLLTQSKTINYLIGSVSGEYLYMNLCEIYIKLLCVNFAVNMETYTANGIIGLSINSTGLLFLKKYLSLNKIDLKLSFYYGKNQKKLILGQIPQKYIMGKYVYTNHKQLNNQWELLISQLRFLQQDLNINNQIIANIDTGSSIILIPSQLYSQILSILQQKISSYCIPKQNGISCPQISQLKQPNLIINQKSQQKLIIQNCFYEQNNGLILFPFIQSKQSLIILGTPFLNQYIFQMDLQKSTYKLYQSNHLQLSQQQQINTLIIFIICVSIIILISAIIFVIIFWIQTKMEKKIII